MLPSALRSASNTSPARTVTTTTPPISEKASGRASKVSRSSMRKRATTAVATTSRKGIRKGSATVTTSIQLPRR